MKKTKAQSAIELIILIGAVMFFFISLLVVFQQNISDKTRVRFSNAFENQANDIRTEIEIASKASEGYKRSFDVPKFILGRNFTINLNNNFLTLKSEDGKISLGMATQNITGQINKGTNIIQKINNQVLLNQ